ncbi:cobalt-zinc-cadmium efflux system membrane fusion protein [Christiangramia gaetbulicola]|uniref:Cobalt-zinc-cadmium efflux system membrane fusion protein n=1 Tax=Christiangramia gaetbulicola TaxID=703340 RepID=A0A2T6AGR1_9FLAO|nr:efflux RND transporter periplasmic adaptor subunit [Christiangramia gaetbulicola]PTX43013.1 cobalt-zinc-cadmium efflux system membrane fusion protein [Christiangramia gaetbulicola]
MNRYILKPILIFPLLLLFFSCGNSEGDSGNDQPEEIKKNGGISLSLKQFESSEMELGKMQEMMFPLTVQATGIIDVPPENKAMINSYTSGYVKQAPLLVGDEVKKGQFLLSLENPEYIQMQQDYLDAMEQMKYLRSEYERQKTLMDENITSEKNYLKAESDYKRNLSKYNALKEKLKMLNLNPVAIENGNISSVIRIYAPISGGITKMNINNGMYVSSSTPLMEIIDRDHLHLELDVFEKDIMKLEKDQEIKFMIPEAQSDTLEGLVHLVGTSIDGQKRTVKVHGHFKDEEAKSKLATGMFVQAEIITNESRQKALPENSVVSMEDRNYVLLLEDQSNGEYSFSRREVITGDTFNGFTIIKNGEDFEEDARFLTKGTFPLITE